MLYLTLAVPSRLRLILFALDPASMLVLQCKGPPPDAP